MGLINKEREKEIKNARNEENETNRRSGKK
jgi:hypothetical protein